VNLNVSENRVFLQILIGVGLLVSLTLLFSTVLGSLGTQDASSASRNANHTKTAVALTADALLGPFPTGTRPSPTATETASITPTASNTSTVTRTPSATPTLAFIITTSRQTREPTLGVLPAQTNHPPPTGTAVQISNTVVPQTNTAAPTRRPTQQPPTNPPPTLRPTTRAPTNPAPTPQPTDPPPTHPPPTIQPPTDPPPTNPAPTDPAPTDPPATEPPATEPPPENPPPVDPPPIEPPLTEPPIP
jgi:hypothetical protein